MWDILLGNRSLTICPGAIISCSNPGLDINLFATCHVGQVTLNIYLSEQKITSVENTTWHGRQPSMWFYLSSYVVWLSRTGRQPLMSRPVIFNNFLDVINIFHQINTFFIRDGIIHFFYWKTLCRLVIEPVYVSLLAWSFLQLRRLVSMALFSSKIYMAKGVLFLSKWDEVFRRWMKHSINIWISVVWCTLNFTMSVAGPCNVFWM